MFLSQTHLPQVLPIESYTSEAHHQREVARLFQPGWHYVGSLGDAPRDGDFFTIELFGQPLIVWNRGGAFHAFLNVCPHRFSMVTEAKCGNTGDRLRCQYHGWEFDETGNTRRIPDARSFRPLQQGALGLRPFRTETVGRLIFVSLAEVGPDLAEFLGNGYDVARAIFSEGRRELLGLTYDLEANWKIKVENTLEDYHIAMVHPKTFIRMPAAEACSDELFANGSIYSAVDDAPTPARRFMDRMIHRIAGIGLDREYRHFIYYPHILFGKMRFTSWIETVFPLSPTRCRVVLKSFCAESNVGRLRRAVSYWGVRLFSGSFGRTAAAEDSAAIRRVQRGLAAGTMPSPGLLSVREERLFHFQEYIRSETCDPSTGTRPSKDHAEIASV